MKISADITISTDELTDDTAMESMINVLARELRERQQQQADDAIAAMESMLPPLRVEIEPPDERLMNLVWSVYAYYSRRLR